MSRNMEVVKMSSSSIAFFVALGGDVMVVIGFLPTQWLDVSKFEAELNVR